MASKSLKLEPDFPQFGHTTTGPPTLAGCLIMGRWGRHRRRSDLYIRFYSEYEINLRMALEECASV